VNRRLIALAAGAALVGALSGCGSQTDERVTPTAESSAPVLEEVAPSGEAASAIASEIAANPFVAIDCISGQATGFDQAPQGTTLGPVTASLQPTGAPTITLQTGAAPATELGIADVAEGTGDEAKAGDTLTVNYCGVGLGTAAMFDSSWQRGQPATFPLDSVIQGWQQGVPGMKVGGTRLLVIPGDLGYGAQGTQGIPPNETLIFVVTLESIS
jgi:peptidylprolyl isomerase